MRNQAKYEHIGTHGWWVVRESPLGWVFEQFSNETGRVTGLKTLLLYGEAGFQRGANLEQPINDYGIPLAMFLAERAQAGITLHHGKVVQ